MSDAPDTLTVLTALQGKLMTKTLGISTSGFWHLAKDYDKAFKFRADPVAISSIDDVARVLAEISADPRKCVIRGAIKQGFEDLAKQGVRRLKRDKGNDKAAFEERPRWWLGCDLDSFELPEDIDPRRDVEHVIDAALEVLPPEFRDVTCFWQLTSGHGIKHGGRARLWFWLSRALTSDECKRWLAHVKLDLSLYQIQQPHYTATPILPDGARDFLVSRYGIRAGGADYVEVPEIQSAPAYLSKWDGTAPNDCRGIDDLGDGDGLKNFHKPLLKEAWKYAWRCLHGQQRDDSAFVEQMRGAILAAPKKPGRDVSRYLDDSYWERSIRGAFERIAAGPEVINAAPVASPRMTADEAAASLAAPTRWFFHDAAPIADARMEAHLRQHEPVLGGAGERVMPSGEQAMALAGIGIGKTHAALTEIAAYIRGSPPFRAKPRRVIYIAPDHNLARDVAGRFRKEFPDVPVHVHFGIEQPDPIAGDAPDTPEEDRTRMCRRWKDAKAVIEAGGEIGALCGSQKRGYCPFHPKSPVAQAGGPVCGRLSTSKPEGGLVILAGPQALTQAPPSALRRAAKVTKPDGEKDSVQLDPADVLVIDEPKFLAMLGGLGAKPYDASPAKLSAKLARFGGLTQPDDEVNSSDVQDAFRALADATVELPAAPLNGADIRRLVQLRDWGQISRSVWWFKADPKDYIEPGWSGSQLHETLASIGKHNRGVTRRSRVCKVIQAAAGAMKGHPDEDLSGLIELVNEDGEPSLRLRWRELIAPAWSGIPTLLLDATGDPEIARKWLPDLKVIADAKAATPACVTRRQVWDSSFPYSSWVPPFPEQPATKESPDLERTCWNNAERMMRLLTVMVARHRGQGRDGIDVLAIAPDRMETALRTLWGRLGGIPEGLALEHFNNIRGVDRYGGVRCLVTVSRPLPSAYDLESIAWTVAGVRGESVADGKLPRSEAAYMLRDGTARRARAVRHPDLMAERIRQQLCDAEVLQAEGRGRAARRTEQNPLDVLILTDTLLGFEIDELVTEDAVMADASFPAWLVASGVVPDLSGKGHWDFLGAVMGKSPDAVREQFRIKKDWGEILESALKCQKFHKNNTHMENLALELFKVRTTRETRYASSVWITANDEPAARAHLLAVGVAPAEVRRAPKAAVPPAPTPLLPSIVAVANVTLAMPLISAFATAGEAPPPDNDARDVPPFDNTLSLEQVAAVQDLCAYWASDDLCFIGTQLLPPVEHRQPRPAASPKPYPARAIAGGYGARLEPANVFAGDRDMAAVEGSWRLSGRGLKAIEERRSAPALLPAGAQAAL